MNYSVICLVSLNPYESRSMDLWQIETVMESHLKLLFVLVTAHMELYYNFTYVVL